jgi:TctA family transporter
MMERTCRTLKISFGRSSVFLTRPISAAFLVAAAVLLLSSRSGLAGEAREAMQE